MNCVSSKVLCAWTVLVTLIDLLLQKRVGGNTILYILLDLPDNFQYHQPQYLSGTRKGVRDMIVNNCFAWGPVEEPGNGLGIEGEATIVFLYGSHVWNMIKSFKILGALLDSSNVTSLIVSCPGIYQCRADKKCIKLINERIIQTNSWKDYVGFGFTLLFSPIEMNWDRSSDFLL